MKTSATVILSIFAIALLSGCAGLQGDPVVINAERLAGIATDTVFSFLKYEEENRAIINNRAVTMAARDIAKNFPYCITSLRTCTRIYKQNRTPENRVSLQTAYALVNAAMLEAQKYLILYSTEKKTS